MTAVPAGLRVLVAEDNSTNRLVALKLLARLGHEAHAVADGADAIAALRLDRYDLILMDMLMPVMDGLAATRAIRSGDPAHAGIAIIGLTALTHSDTVQSCLFAGMDAVATKPVTVALLTEAITRALAVRGRHAVRLAQAGPLGERLRLLADGLGEDAVREIVATFAEDATATLMAMRASAEQGQTASVYRMAHSLAAAALNVGAEALGGRAAALEADVGEMEATEILDALAAMQTDLAAALADLGVSAG